MFDIARQWLQVADMQGDTTLFGQQLGVCRDTRRVTLHNDTCYESIPVHDRRGRTSDPPMAGRHENTNAPRSACKAEEQSKGEYNDRWSEANRLPVTETQEALPTTTDSHQVAFPDECPVFPRSHDGANEMKQHFGEDLLGDRQHRNRPQILEAVPDRLPAAARSPGTPTKCPATEPHDH